MNKIKKHIRSLRVKRKYRKAKSAIMELFFTLLVLPNRIFCFGGLNTSPREQKIVVSMTSIPPRLSLIHLAIESIMRQTVKPDRIVLWLSKEYKKPEFGGFDWQNLPASLTNLESRGLEITFTKDIGPFQKLIPSLKRFPDDIVITMDDDVFYDSDTIDKLYKAYLENGVDCLYCKRSRIFTMSSARSFAPYEGWQTSFSSADNDRGLFYESSGGGLYPPHIFDEEVFREDIFSSLTPNNDDIWVNAMVLRRGKTVFQVETRDAYRLRNESRFSLVSKNVAQDENAPQLKAVFDHYNLYGKLKKNDGNP
ncbi:MAG: hypothetical protein ACR2NQ_00955 [Thermodesulfobacteriota bacterium]